MNESLTNRQIAFIVFGIVVGYGILGLAKNIGEESGTGGWFTLIIAMVIAIIFTYIITYLGYVHENKTIYEYSNLLVGKFITYIFMFIYISIYFFIFSMSIRISSEAIKLTILLKTPVWALSFLFVLVVYYAVIKRLSVIARICEIYGLIIIIGVITVHAAIFTQGEWINLRPFFVLEDIGSYFKATSTTILPFLGMEILVIVSFNRKKNDRRIFKYTTCMIVLIGMLYIFIVESCISVMGVDGIIYYEDALFSTIRRINIESFQFLERIDGIFLMQWIMAIFCSLTLEAYTSVFLMSKIFKNIHFELLSFIVVILAFIVSQVPTSIDEVEKILNYAGYGALLTGGVIPMILFFVTKVKKYDQKLK